ncbi:hypothetical protein [Bdellovibrio sp. KM01]|uniref:hypothetical protein n=1 Tax=Bdellovibrio sp. KM01 TaxID=2748865 RepID=UPI0015EA2493|nr:hypothetical protein [Bdellovibrio sp. KM01]QLY24918.1 hypothetical protein HW988_16030 [Bdellovibrio sp. KM01]
MIRNIFLSAVSVIVLGSTSVAETLSNNELTALLGKVDRVREAIKVSAQQTQACTPPSPESCSFESYCGKLAERGSEAYLYQDSEGYQIPNYSYLFFAEEAEICARNVHPPLIDDPFFYPEQFVDVEKAGGKENLQKNQQKLAKATDRMKSIYEDTKAHIISILNKRKTESNKAQIENMIERVKSVRVKIGTPGPAEKMAAQGCETPNAAYNMQLHELMICPQVMNMPESSLFTVFGHELGHSFDPCAVAMDFTKTGAKFPNWMNKIVASSTGPVAFKGMAAGENPFGSVISCLESPSSIHIKIPDKKELKKVINSQLSQLDSFVDSGQDQEDGEGNETVRAGIGARDATRAGLEDSLDNIDKYYDQFRGCPDISGSVFIEEAFADWVASQALGEKLESLPAAKKSEYAFAAPGVFYSATCPALVAQSYAKAKAMAPKCASLQKFSVAEKGEMGEFGLPHPEMAERVNRIYFAKPEIKKALSCQSGETGTECK